MAVYPSSQNPRMNGTGMLYILLRGLHISARLASQVPCPGGGASGSEKRGPSRGEQMVEFTKRESRPGGGASGGRKARPFPRVRLQGGRVGRQLPAQHWGGLKLNPGPAEAVPGEIWATRKPGDGLHKRHTILPPIICVRTGLVGVKGGNPRERDTF